MLKHRYISAIFFWLMTISGISLLSVNSHAQLAQDTAYDKTVFWQITGNGLRDTSYLYGTMHPVFREDVHVAHNMLDALLQAKIVFFEHEIYDSNDSLYLEMNAMERPVLLRLLGGICYSKLEEKLQQLGDSITTHSMFLRLPPSFIGGRLLNGYFGNTITTFEAILYAIVMGNAQQVAYLDTPEMIKKMNELLPLDEQATQLYFFLQHFDQSVDAYTKNVKTFTRLYYSGDIGRIYTRSSYLLLNDKLSGMHVLENTSATKLLDDRNKKWMPSIMQAIQQQSSFFAIGAAHLAGRLGLINLLRKKGYTLTPLPLQF